MKYNENPSYPINFWQFIIDLDLQCDALFLVTALQGQK